MNINLRRSIYTLIATSIAGLVYMLIKYNIGFDSGWKAWLTFFVLYGAAFAVIEVVYTKH